jgi:class 3 adenylate cyclase/tetratricopeptide (TPR) repeat protein
VNPDEDRFCSDCGAPVGVACPSCSAVVPPGKRFCGRCGTAVAAVEDAAQVDGAAPRTPVAERRVCSVLFCDIVGFTPLSEARDAEEVRELLSRYFETARTVIARYGGVVEKFIGDAVMAVWGTPVALEGDTERAVRGALELVDAIAALGVELSVPSLAARAGIVTGEVAVTLGASNEGMVAGDSVNTAARVQAAAEPGSVLVDEATRRLAQAGIAFDDTGEHELKGKVEPQRLWRAGRVLSGVGGAQRVDGLEAPLTGRDVELRLIKDLYHASVDRRQPRLVVVSGPAGVGKSRLGWEFEKYVDGLSELTFWHRGRCLSYGDGVAFWALAEIVRQRLGIAEEDAVDDAAAKLVEGVEAHLDDPQERLYVGARLARLLGLPFPGDSGGEIDRAELFAGWRLWFERLAAASPVAILVEDVQYADAGLLDFLDHLVDWARDVPLFVLAFSRPELDQVRPGWGSGRNRTLLGLDPLDASSMDGLIEALVPGIPPEAVAAIAEQAQGIPLFAVETIRSLIDRDVVVPREGVYRLAGEVGALTVPDSLHGLLAARLDGLDPASRRLVAEASVLGTSFPLEALVAVSGQPEAEVRASVADLVRREVLAISADRLSPQQGTYRFAHEMLRQVAYDTLSRRDRKAGHLAVAAHLRSSFPRDGEEVVDVLAQHYLDALRAVPTDPDAGEVRGEAVAALVRAGERAKRTGAPRRAMESYESAADLLQEGAGEEDVVRVAELLERAAREALDGALGPRAVELGDRAADLYEGAGLARSAARAAGIAGWACRLAGRHTEARQRLTAAVQVLRDNPDADTVRALHQLAGLEVFSGTSEADRVTQEGVVLGQALAVGPEDLCAVFGIRAVWLAQNGRRPEGIALQREAARLAEQAGNSGRHGIILMNLADILTPDDPVAAARTAQLAAEHLRRTGFRGYLIYALLNKVAASLEAGDWATAETVLSVTVQEDGLADDDEVACYRALFAGLRGDVGTAESLLAGLGQLLQTEAPQERAFVMTARAFSAAASGRTQDAFDLARQVVALADAIGIGGEQPRWNWPLAVRCAYDLGDAGDLRELLAILDNYPPGDLVPMLVTGRALARACLADLEGDAEAGRLFEVAVSSLRAKGSPYHLAHGLLDHAGHLVRAGQDARAVVEEAAAIATALGAAPVLARAETLLQSLRSELRV